MQHEATQRPCGKRGCVAMATWTGYCTIHSKNFNYSADRDHGSTRRKPDTLVQPDMVESLPPESGVWLPKDRH